MSDSAQQQAFHELGPETVLDAVEQASGGLSDGRILALNSYENRVYSVGMEQGAPLIAKFYRPGRWSDATILEEHHYSLELQQAEINLVAPLADEAGQTLHHTGPYRFALYPRVGGHAPELDDAEVLERIGQQLGRLHATARRQRFQHRPALNPHNFVAESREYLLQHDIIPDYLLPAYESVSAELSQAIEQHWALNDMLPSLRLHGDLHSGNLLLRDDLLQLVDLDDCRNGPAIQDFWMLLGGSAEEQQYRLRHLLQGYELFMDFDPLQLELIETLRSMRIIHYAAWLARRRADPAFVQAFPWFFQPRYWEEHVLALREQLALLQND